MLKYFVGFDQLIGTRLIKVLYYVGLVGIGLFAITGIFGGFAAMGSSFLGGLGAIVMAIIGALVGAAFWRFMCEIYMLFFRMSDDLRDIKNHQLGRPANTDEVNIGS